MSLDAKGKLLRLLYGRWRGRGPTEDGYAIVWVFPHDMPFLLRFALEGLKYLDLDHCRQVIVVGDGVGGPTGPFREMIAAAGDPRIAWFEPTAVDRAVVPLLRGAGSSLHWLAAVRATAEARTRAIFLHDIDSFFLESGGIERQYRELVDRDMATLGVEARLDAFFRRGDGFAMPGTWELMFSNAWARSHRPDLFKGRYVLTPEGPNVFDTLLYPQYLDRATGRVGVMADPPRFVHFNGAIGTQRAYRNATGPVKDELFRLLILAILAELIPGPSGTGWDGIPTVAGLARGLDDPAAPVGYDSKVAVQEYPIFRKMVDDLCGAPIMRGDRADRIDAMLRPFDDHFAARPADPALGSIAGHRTTGLG